MKISYSRARCYRSCPQRYKLQYIDKKPTPEYPPFIFGNLIHETLEYLHSPRHPQLPLPEELLSHYEVLYAATSSGFQKDHPDYFALGKEMLQKYLAKIPSSPPRTLAVEKFFTLPLNDSHKLTGVIDRVDELPNGTLEVIDYKTGRTLPDQQQVNKDLQLSIYWRAAYHLWEASQIKLTFYYLYFDHLFNTSRSKKDFEEVKYGLLETIEEIEQGKFPPKPGQQCKWCLYSAWCPAKNPPTLLTPVDEKIGELMEEFHQSRIKVKEWTEKLSLSREKIIEYCQKRGIDQISREDKILTLKEIVRWEYDEKELKELLLPLRKWDEVSGLDKKKLETFLATDELTPLEKYLVKKTRKQTGSHYQISVKKIGG